MIPCDSAALGSQQCVNDNSDIAAEESTWSYLASLTALRLTAGGMPRQLSTFKKRSFDTSCAAAQQ